MAAAEFSICTTSFINEAAIEVRGTKPLAAPLEKRSRTSATGNSWRALSAKHSGPTRTHSTIQTFHSPNLFGLWVAPGFEDTSRYSAYLLQGGLALQEHKYYLSQSDAMKEIRQKYRAHIAAVMKLAGFDNVDEPRGSDHHAGACDCGEALESGRRQRREESQQPLEGIGVRVEGSGAWIGWSIFRRPG